VSDKYEYTVKPVNEWGIFGAFNPLLWIYLGLLIYVNYLVPLSWFETDNQIVELAIKVKDSIKSVIRVLDISNHANATNFPKATLVNSAILWTSLPVCLAYHSICAVVNARARAETFWNKLGLKEYREKKWMIPSVIPILLAMLVVATVIPGKPSLKASSDLINRGFASELTFCFFIIIYGGTAALPVWIVARLYKPSEDLK
jgi:hypothetical protein